MRSGDTVAMARAWDRLRGAGDALPADQAAVARAARLAVGRAIRSARWRRLHEQAPAELRRVAVLPRRRRGLGRVLTFVALAAASALLILLVPVVPADPAPPPPLDSQDTTGAVQAPAEARLGGRGRTSATLAPIALPSPTPIPTESPTPAPSEPPADATAEPDESAEPSETRRPGATEGPDRSGDPGGEEGGSEGGVVGGVPGASGTGAPAPTLNVLPRDPPALLGDHDRLTFRVVDARSRRTITGVCVVYGTGDCTPSRPHTNERGLYWLDLPRGQAAQLWDFRFYYRGYATATLQLVHTPGRSQTVEIRLRRR